MKELLLGAETIVVLPRHMEGELNSFEGLGDTAQVADADLALCLLLLNVVDFLVRDQNDALLRPPEHVDLLHLVREQQCLYIINRR